LKSASYIFISPFLYRTELKNKKHNKNNLDPRIVYKKVNICYNEHN